MARLQRFASTVAGLLSRLLVIGVESIAQTDAGFPGGINTRRLQAERTHVRSPVSRVGGSLMHTVNVIESTAHAPAMSDQRLSTHEHGKVDYRLYIGN